MSLRRRFSLLVAIGLTPPFLLVVFNTARWQIHLENNVRSMAVADARLVSNELTQVMKNGRELMLTLSKYPPVSTDEYACGNYFQSVIAEISTYRAAAIIDTKGRFHCSTIPIPLDLDVSDRAYFREPLKTGNFTIGQFTQGRVTKASSIHLSMPYKSTDGSLTGVIAVVLNPEKLAENLVELPWHPRDSIIVLDRDGSVVLTIPKRDRATAQLIARDVYPRLIPNTSESLDSEVIADNPQIVAYAPVLAGSGSLSVLVAVDKKVALAEAWNITARNLAIGLATLLLAIGGAWMATHFMIIRPLRAVVATARRRERGDTTARFPNLSQLSEFGQLSAALARMSDRVDTLLSQKGLLLRELQHRVMNSLNLLSSMFDMQARQGQTTLTTRTQLSRARDRVVAMGTIYRFLYNTDAVDDIEISELLKQICRESENAYEGPVKRTIEVDADPLLLSGTNAIALAMLTHELIMNAIKHAYAEHEPGPIAVRLKRLPEGGFEYRFADRGRGLPKGFKLESAHSLGMIMITATAQQLNAEITVHSLEPGTEFVLRLPPEIESVKTEVDLGSV